MRLQDRRLPQDDLPRSEIGSRDLDILTYQENVVLDWSRPGKPTDNSFIEALQWRVEKREVEHA